MCAGLCHLSAMRPFGRPSLGIQPYVSRDAGGDRPRSTAQSRSEALMEITHTEARRNLAGLMDRVTVAERPRRLNDSS
jgi:hypothetical protein